MTKMNDEIKLDYKLNIEKINSKYMIPIPDIIQCVAEIAEGDEIHWIIESDEFKNITTITLKWI